MATGEYENQPYSVELLRDGSAQVEYELAREDRSEVARMLYALMQARFPGRVVVPRVGDIVLDRSDS